MELFIAAIIAWCVALVSWKHERRPLVVVEQDEQDEQDEKIQALISREQLAIPPGILTVFLRARMHVGETLEQAWKSTPILAKIYNEKGR